MVRLSVVLGYLELCLTMWLTCLHVGGRMSFLECYGVEDDPSLSYVVFVKGKKMRDILRILRGLWRSSSSFSFLLSYLDNCLLAPLVISFIDFLVLFSHFT